MTTISQRELRNDNAAIMRRVEDGERFVVTRRGVPVAELGPVGGPGDLPCDRPARTRPRWAGLPRVAGSSDSTGTVLDDLRGDR